MIPAPITRAAIEHALSSGAPSFIRQRLGGGTFASARYPYLHVSTPKCACTKTKTLLWHLEQLGPRPRDIHARPPGDPRLSALSVAPGRALELLFGRSIFRFRLWRDPVDRLVSAYLDKIRGAEPWFAPHREAIVQRFSLPHARDISFDHFAAYACAQPDEERDQHWMSQHRLALADALAFDAVVKVESYAADMARVYAAIGVPPERWPSFETRLNAAREKIAVSTSTAELIRRSYPRDCESPAVATRP